MPKTPPRGSSDSLTKRIAQQALISNPMKGISLSHQKAPNKRITQQAPISNPIKGILPIQTHTHTNPATILIYLYRIKTISTCQVLIQVFFFFLVSFFSNYATQGHTSLDHYEP